MRDASELDCCREEILEMMFGWWSITTSIMAYLKAARISSYKFLHLLSILEKHECRHLIRATCESRTAID